MVSKSLAYFTAWAEKKEKIKHIDALHSLPLIFGRWGAFNRVAEVTKRPLNEHVAISKVTVASW